MQAINRTEITLDTADGKFGAYLATPAGAATAPSADGGTPAILVIQEIFGVNQGMRQICDHWAQNGYLALCPDLFWRQEPGVQLTDQTDAEWQRAFAFYNSFDEAKGLMDLKTALQHLRTRVGARGKVGTIGYCLGGRLSFRMACESDADANISYYGVGIDGLLAEGAQVQKPLLMHIAEKDKFSTPEAQEKIMAALSANPRVSLHRYLGVDHAFARPNGIHFDAAAATLANRRSDDFFAAQLQTLRLKDAV